MNTVERYRIMVEQTACDLAAVLARRVAKKAGGGRVAEAIARQHHEAAIERVRLEEVRLSAAIGGFAPASRDEMGYY